MGINRIVTHNGVVWWLPPLRPRCDRAAEGFIPLEAPGFHGIEAILGGTAGDCGTAGPPPVEGHPEGCDGSAPDGPADGDGCPTA